MDLAVIFIVTAVVLLALLAAGVWIGAALGLLAVGLYLVYGGFYDVQAIAYLGYNTLTKYDFVAMPLFIFMATILASCGVTERLYAGTASLFARLPGGLIHANIMGCAMFAAVCGSTAATTAAMSTIALPELEKRGYPSHLSLGSLAGSGTLGTLIPPSGAFIVYAVLTNTSVGQLFLAGLVPGVLLAVMFSTYVIIRTCIKKDIAPERMPWRQTGRRLLSTWPVLALFVVVLGSIYLGIATAVEAGAIGCTGALIVGAMFRKLTWSSIREALRDGTNTTALIFFVLMGGVLLGYGLSNLGIPQYLLKTVLAWNLSPAGFLIVLTIVYLILGCFLDGGALTVITVPIVFPIVVAMGFDPVWFGVLLVLFTNMAAITPPVGVNIFVLQAITGKPLEQIVKGILPFIIIILFMVLWIALFPSIALYLPGTMR